MFFALIDWVSEAGREPAGWREAAGRIAQALGASGGGMQIHDARSWQPKFCAQFGLEREQIDDYIAGFMLDNPVVRAAVRLPVGTPIADRMVISKRQLMRSPIYADWGRRNSVHAMANVVLARERGQFANFNLLRSRSLGDFERDDIELMQTLSPHLVRAVEMNRLLDKLNRERYAAYAALEQLDTGVVFVRADGFVVHMNAAAEAMIAAHDGLGLANNRFNAGKNGDTARLLHLIQLAAAHNGARGGTTTVERPSVRRPYLVRVYPLSAKGRFKPPEGASVSLFITDPTAARLMPTDFAGAFGLTLCRSLRLALYRTKTPARTSSRA